MLYCQRVSCNKNDKKYMRLNMPLDISLEIFTKGYIPVKIRNIPLWFLCEFLINQIFGVIFC